MSTTGTDRVRRERTDVTNRRFLLTLVTGGIGALLSLPAQAHHRDLMFGAEPVSTPQGSSDRRSPFADLKEVGAQHRVVAIRHSRASYRVVTADGRRVDVPESDLRLKVDSSATGPRRGEPVILPAGHVGDRASVFFAAPDEISAFVKY